MTSKRDAQALAALIRWQSATGAVAVTVREPPVCVRNTDGEWGVVFCDESKRVGKHGGWRTVTVHSHDEWRAYQAQMARGDGAGAPA